MRESEELIEQARNQVFEALEAAKGEEDGARRPVDWQTIRNRIRDVLAKFVYEKTRRRPMILPLVMEV
jgi:ribonuclease J